EDPFPPTTVWRGAMRGLLERAIERHGGWDAWRKVAGASLVPVSVTGVLPATKGLGVTFPLPSRIEVWPREAAAIFHDYPSPGCSGVFASGAVEIVRPDGAVVAAVADARATFRGWAKHRRWSPADGLYFFGYALTHHH